MADLTLKEFVARKKAFDTQLHRLIDEELKKFKADTGLAVESVSIHLGVFEQIGRNRETFVMKVESDVPIGGL